MRFIRRVLVILVLASGFTASAQEISGRGNGAVQHHLMPVPASLQFNSGRLVIDANFRVEARGHVDERLRSGIVRAINRLEKRVGWTLPRELQPNAAEAKMVIECVGPGKDVPAVDEDESYALDISEKQAVLKSNTVVGVLRGLETLLQLLTADRESFFFPAVRIDDKPRFPWRGLLIDVGRHFQPVEIIKNNLDAMAAVKLNVLHWHLTEDQGFRIESRKYPKLHEMGSDGLFYTQEQIRDVVVYARERGIRVMPEFDMPGHATSWFVGHPELSSGAGPYQIERRFGVAEVEMDPTREEVYEFLDNFIGEMAALFPDAYLHIGGDEVAGKQWKANRQIQAFMKEKGFQDNAALQTYFNQRLLTILKKHGKRMMGWDEILQPGLPKDIVVHSWRGPDSLVQAAKQGYDGLLSAGYYIDLVQPAAKHYSVDPLGSASGLAEEAAKHILGGEATMWGEAVSTETIDSRIWPRTAAIAERLWSPAGVTDVSDMYRRLDAISVQLEEFGLTHNKNSEMLLRRLAGTSNIGALSTLVSLLEPVKGYDRYKYQQINALTPLTHLVDAAVPDSDAARRFHARVDSLLNDAPRFIASRSEIQKDISDWWNAAIAVYALANSSPNLQAAALLAEDLNELASLAGDALEVLAKRQKVRQRYRELWLARISEIGKPKAALEFAMLSAIRELVVAAAEWPQLKSTPPTEWRARVKSLAATNGTRK